MSLGFFVTAHKELKATEEILKNIRLHHPSDPIFLVSDGGYDFQKLFENLEISNVYFKMDEDSLSSTFQVTDKNFRQKEQQQAIHTAINCFLERITEAISIMKVTSLVVADPDTKFRRNLEYLTGRPLIGSLVNTHLPTGVNSILLEFGGVEIKGFGANPAIFRVDKFEDGLKRIESVKTEFFTRLSNEFYAVYAYDLLIPIVFSMAGEQEEYNREIVECRRNRFWRFSSKAIVHQYRRYYD
jgi:hypothetical protein